MSGTRDYQIDIEISEDTLRSHGVSLPQVASVVRRENYELPGGTIRAKSQEVLLRGHNRRLTGEEIAKLPLITQRDGAVLTIGDLGVVRDEFTDTASVSELNGQPVLVLSVQRSATEDLLAMVDAVKQFVAEAEMPEGYRLTTWADRSKEVRGRIDLLVRNGIQGLLIVFLILATFLELRLAFWIALGIPFSLMASSAYLYFTGQTLNMISMFAFIMALGIVVDDAIVIGENIYAHRQMGKSYWKAALDGAVEVVPSVIASVTTTVIAFMPLLFVSGIMGKIVCVLPTVIITMLVVSLGEAITILPCHLSHRDSVLLKLIYHVFYIFRWVAHLLRWINRVATVRRSPGSFAPCMLPCVTPGIGKPKRVPGRLCRLIDPDGGTGSGRLYAMDLLSENRQQFPPGGHHFSRRDASRRHGSVDSAYRRIFLASCRTAREE